MHRSRKLVKTDEIEIDGQAYTVDYFEATTRRGGRRDTAPSWSSDPAIASLSTAARWAIWSGVWRG